MGFSCGSAGKESACNVGGLGSIPELGRSSGEGNGYALQYPGLENSMDCIVHGVTRVRYHRETFSSLLLENKSPVENFSNDTFKTWLIFTSFSIFKAF